MDKPDLRRFIKTTERMVSPKAVGKLYGRAEMLSKLPVGVQKRIVERASRDSSRIGFVVEPYSFFLAYEIADEAEAKRQLPPGYELLPTAMFEGTEPRLCGIVAAFNVHTSVFWGSRVEFYLIAENTATGMLSWVICDYETNTISYDPGQGFSGSSTSHCVITTAHSGELIVDVKSEQRAATTSPASRTWAQRRCERLTSASGSKGTSPWTTGGGCSIRSRCPSASSSTRTRCSRLCTSPRCGRDRGQHLRGHAPGRRALRGVLLPLRPALPDHQLPRVEPHHRPRGPREGGHGVEPRAGVGDRAHCGDARRPAPGLPPSRCPGPGPTARPLSFRRSACGPRSSVR